MESSYSCDIDSTVKKIVNQSLGYGQTNVKKTIQIKSF